MLRWVTGLGRRGDEPWVDFVKRSTHTSERLAREHGVKDWLQAQQWRKWKLAGEAARRTDKRWSHRLLNWKPFFRKLHHRDVGRPCLRWSDSLVEVAGGEWVEAAVDKGLWLALSYGHQGAPT